MSMTVIEIKKTIQSILIVSMFFSDSTTNKGSVIHMVCLIVFTAHEKTPSTLLHLNDVEDKEEIIIVHDLQKYVQCAMTRRCP